MDAQNVWLLGRKIWPIQSHIFYYFMCHTVGPYSHTYFIIMCVRYSHTFFARPLADSRAFRARRPLAAGLKAFSLLLSMSGLTLIDSLFGIDPYRGWIYIGINPFPLCMHRGHANLLTVFVMFLCMHRGHAKTFSSSSALLAIDPQSSYLWKKRQRGGSPDTSGYWIHRIAS